MKKQLVTLTGTLLLGSMAFAQSMTCQISTGIIAKESYLTPGNATFTVSAKLNEDRALERGLDNFHKFCTKSKIEKLDIEFCAKKTAFAGVFEVAAFVSSDGDKETLTLAQATLGTLANGKGLDSMSGSTAISPLLIKKLSAAGIDMPGSMEGDSLMVDEALLAATGKKLLVEGELVSLDIDNCQIK